MLLANGEHHVNWFLQTQARNPFEVYKLARNGCDKDGRYRIPIVPEHQQCPRSMAAPPPPPPGDIAPPFSPPNSPCNLSTAEDFDLTSAVQKLAPIARPQELHLSIREPSLGGLNKWKARISAVNVGRDRRRNRPTEAPRASVLKPPEADVDKYFKITITETHPQKEIGLRHSRRHRAET
ncbi:hypothetical protein NIT7645_02279 [Phaeobacter italicus]|nr:hypothetical protein NIT7645_02279 [Phaeobacter italicus]